MQLVDMTPEARAEMQAEAAELRRWARQLGHAPLRPVGDNWQASRAEQRATVLRHADRIEEQQR